MIRKVIRIDEEKCNGCGLCASACQEGAIGLVEGKARLLRDDYCDGLGNCLPACPTNAITFEEREAAAYDEEAVQKHLNTQPAPSPMPHMGGCPGSMARSFSRAETPVATPAPTATSTPESQLMQWPVQIKLLPVSAPFYNQANLLVAADCAAYARADFHDRFLKNHIVLIGCPKLDDIDYTEKLTAILRENDIKSLKVIRMEVPCCGGLEHAVRQALLNSGKMIPWQVVTLSTDGRILDE
ncbi:MAG TPA: 4Fe-4S ferredoxin [Ruminococcaceae bacterium]|nr:4Fe-4S ferredoxin [Oscillospiraceae bacterium]